MAGGLTVSVRQVASYPLVTQATLSPNDLVLLQQGGMGGPYASVTAGQLVSSALMADGPAFAVGTALPADAGGNQAFIQSLTLPFDGPLFWNAYHNTQGLGTYVGGGVAGAFNFTPPYGFTWAVSPSGLAGGTIPGFDGLMTLDLAGGLSLSQGTLRVARDPNAALEVATMGWVGANTVASFNGRRGLVTLSANDVYTALCLDPCDPFITVSQTNQAICAAIQQLLQQYPGVSTWNGRLGNVWMNTCDLNIATFTALPGMPPLMVPTPLPADATPSPPDPLSVVNVAWVENYISETAGLATEEWVTEQLANALQGTVSSFNTRTGAVTLLLADVIGVGGAPSASPGFSGIPTAPTANPGTSTAQLATTAFVMNTITALTPGVVSFNGRAGTVTLDATDINNAGGALIASPNFTGVPAAPTAAAGTATSQIATTAFVMAEIAATTAGVVSFNGRSGVVTLNVNDITSGGGAPAASPSLTGIPTAPTAANGTSTQQIATTAFVLNEISAINSGVLTFNGRSGTVTLTQNDVTAVGGLVNPSPALSGTPTAPTPAPTDSSTNIATTAFVHAALANVAGATVSATAPPSPTTGQLWFNTGVTPPQLMVYNGTAWVVSTNLTAYAPLASPAFSGTPTAPTPTAGNNSTSLATTAFVQAALAGYLPLSGGTLTGALAGPSLNLTGTGTALNVVGNAAIGGTLGVQGTVTTQGQVTVGTNLVMGSPSGQLQFQQGTSGGIRGDTSGTGAAAGMVGEFQQQTTGPSGISGSGGTQALITLPAGDWLVSYNVQFAPSSSTMAFVQTLAYVNGAFNANGTMSYPATFSGQLNMSAGPFRASGSGTINITCNFSISYAAGSSCSILTSAVAWRIR